MKETIRLGVLTDDAPVNDQVIANGMCRVNTRLLNALTEEICSITVTNTTNHFHLKDITESLQDRCELLSLVKLPHLGIKIVRRIFPKVLERDMVLDTMMPRLVRQLHQDSINWIFCPCGSDPSALGRGFRLAQASGLPLAVYLVDDFLAGAQLSGHQTSLELAQAKVPDWLRKVDKIFVISEGLRQSFNQRYGITSTVLPLPYQLPDIPNAPRIQKKQIIFVGSLSHFYLDGLKQLAGVIDKINRETNDAIQLRLTTSNVASARHCIGAFDCLHCEPCENAEKLYEEITNSLLCFISYSFQKQYREMVATSFPSKMLDYLTAGKFIIALGPKYSSFVSYFHQYQLSKLLCVNDPDALEKVILDQIKNPQDLSATYKNVVKQNHSYHQIRRIILDDLIA